MKLELKNLLPYIPYGLKIYDESDGSINNLVIAECDVQSLSDYTINYVLHNEDLKPILRPPELMYETIEDEEGNISRLTDHTSIHFCTYSSELNGKKWFGGILCAEYEDYQLLFKWHIDFQKLIKNGLAIDATTIKKS